MTLPFAISFAITADIALNAGAAVFGPQHFTLVPSPMGQFGVLVACGIIVHEAQTAAVSAAKFLHRWWRRRQERRRREREQKPPQPPAAGR